MHKIAARMKQAVRAISDRLHAVALQIQPSKNAFKRYLELLAEPLQQLEEQVANLEALNLQQADLINKLYYANDQNALSAEKWRDQAEELARENQELKARFSAENEKPVNVTSYDNEGDTVVVQTANRSTAQRAKAACVPCYVLLLDKQTSDQYPKSLTCEEMDDYEVAELLNEYSYDVYFFATRV